MSPFHRKKPTDAADRPLMFAQTSSAAASIAPSEPGIDPSRSSKDSARSYPASEAAAVEDPQEQPAEQSLARPQTPPQGSNYTAWSSYRNLPVDHPVFRYPDKVREDMYAKGVDPVVKAELDLARLGKVYGESHHGKSFWKRGTSMMGQFGTRATGGSF